MTRRRKRNRERSSAASTESAGSKPADQAAPTNPDAAETESADQPSRKERRTERVRKRRTRRKAGRTADRSQGIRPWILPGFLGIAAIAIVLVAASVVMSEDQAIADAGARTPSPAIGEPTAQVVIHEYADYLCPFCGRFARSIKPEIQERYIDTGIVRLVWHDIIGHGQGSRDTANAARCAGDQGRYWQYHDFLYDIQQGAGHGTYSDERLKEYGDAMGLEPGAFHACIDERTYDQAIDADMRASRQQGISGTPTFTIGDQRIVGAQPLEIFEQAIARELRAQG
jgi:protein-disulfide isomerase